MFRSQLNREVLVCAQKLEQLWGIVGAEEIRSYDDIKRLLVVYRNVGDFIGWWVGLAVHATVRAPVC